MLLVHHTECSLVIYVDRISMLGRTYIFLSGNYQTYVMIYGKAYPYDFYYHVINHFTKYHLAYHK